MRRPVTIFALLALCGAASANRLLWSVSGPAEAEGGGAGYTDTHWAKRYVYFGGTTNASGDAVDLGPNGLDATAGGSQTATGGVYVLGGASGEHYDIGTVEAIACPRTISVWASFTVFANANYNLYWGDDGNGDYYGFRDMVGDVRFVESFSGLKHWGEYAGLDDGAWRMYTTADDGTNCVLYINGIQQNSAASAGGNADIEFFAMGFSAAYVFEGYLDEGIIWTNTCFTSNQVLELYEATTDRNTQPVGN